MDISNNTFHKLAIDIIGKATGTKPSICDNTDSLFIDIYHTLLENKAFKNSVVEYFIDYQSNEADWEQRKNERREKLSEQKNVQLKAMFPDMDGRAIYVRSEQEQKICFVLSSLGVKFILHLFSLELVHLRHLIIFGVSPLYQSNGNLHLMLLKLGVKFRYEEPYEHQLADEMHSQYRPDFSIYFEQAGVIKRIYLEHFGVDEQKLSAKFLMSCFLPSYTIIIFLIGFFVCYIFVFCKPSGHKTMFINSKMVGLYM